MLAYWDAISLYNGQAKQHCVRRALSTRCDEPARASRPWDTGRDGFVMGEGAGVMVFESLEHAQKRGAPIIAEYLGGAFTCDAHHMTDPRPDGLGVSTCIELALKDAGVDRDAVSADVMARSVPFPKHLCMRTHVAKINLKVLQCSCG